jgi:hypothetical protein
MTHMDVGQALTGGQMFPPRGSPSAYTLCTMVSGAEGTLKSGIFSMSTGYSQVMGVTAACAHQSPGGHGISTAGVGQ